MFAEPNIDKMWGPKLEPMSAGILLPYRILMGHAAGGAVG
jgi:hypothetical protein